MSKLRVALIVAGLCLGAGCRDRDTPRGRTSHGEAADAGDDSMRARLVYATESALDSIRVVKRMRARLDDVGVPEDRVSLVADAVHVDVEKDQVDKTKGALSGGRLDIIAESTTDRLEGVMGSGGLKLEKGFLSAPVAERSALAARVRELAGDAVPLVGPLGDGARYRSWFGDKKERLRGEFLVSAEAKDGALRLTFEGSGIGYLARHTKANTRLLVVIDDEVVAQVMDEDPIEDGVVTVRVKDAPELAGELSGRALSHLTTFVLQTEVVPMVVP
jgi:hypothetical protein